MRYSDEYVDELLDSVNIEEYIGQFVDLEQKGSEFFGLCPFHNEDTPSFSVTPSTGKFFCFGCHKGGNVLTFIKLYNHVGCDDAKRMLSEYCGGDTKFVQKPKRLSAVKIAKKFVVQSTQKEAKYKVLPDDVMDKYEDAKEKLDIWRQEEIRDRELEKYNVKYDAISNRLVFPIRSVSGEIINISGRTLCPDYKNQKISKYTYMCPLGRLDTMFGAWENKENILRKKEVIIFEGAKSVMKAEGFGFDNCVAALTSRINKYQLKLLVQMGCRVVFAFDSDVDISKVDLARTLKHYVPVEVVADTNHILGEKMSPVDMGEEIWTRLYKERIRI